MDLNVKGASLGAIVSSVESGDSQSDKVCEVDFSSFLTIYSLHSGLVQPKVPPEKPVMWIPTPSGQWIQVHHSLISLIFLAESSSSSGTEGCL